MYYLFEHDGVICTRADLIEYLWDNRLYSDTSYHNEELKSLTRYRFDKVKERAKLKSSVSRLVCILFPELERLDAVANAHLTRLSNLLFDSSKGRYGKDTAVMFRDAARSSIGSHMPAKSLKLKHTIKLIRELAIEIDEIEAAIKRIMDEEIQSPIFTIPGISYRMGAMIIAEIGDFSRFIPQIRYSHMQECLPPLINPDS